MAVLIFVIVLLSLILVHEFGHFIVAKKLGLRVDEFGIGFPPRATRLVKKGETEYTLNWLPFGGFVKIFGEDPEDEALSGPDSERSFAHASKWTQAAVLVAGVAFNILAAWLLFSVAFMAGINTSPEGGHWFGEVRDTRVAIAQVLPDSPAQEAGIIPGDSVTSLSAGDESVTPATPEEVTAFVNEHAGEEITVTYMRGSTVGQAVVEAQQGVIESSPERQAVGIATTVAGTLQLPPHLALIEGVRLTYEMTGAVAVGLGSFFAQVFTFNADLSQVAGPVGIVGLVGDASALGLVPLLTFTAFISINLAIINLLPFPALDGGRLLFVAIEALKGSPIRPQVANTLNALGFAFLILLMLAVTYNDIVRIVS